MVEWLRVIFHYYRRLFFLYLDILLAAHYVFSNPHKVSKTFLKAKGEKNLYGYGETPLTTLDKICRQCRILSKDTIIELGCGSGRTLFWLHSFIKCRVIGVDFLPLFIKRAQRIVKWAKLDHIDFRNEDMLHTDLTHASVIYLYGTCLEDEVIEKLLKKFQTLPVATKVITVSYPLTDYCEGRLFRVEKSFMGNFPWGKAEIFLNIRSHTAV